MKKERDNLTLILIIIFSVLISNILTLSIIKIYSEKYPKETINFTALKDYSTNEKKTTNYNSKKNVLLKKIDKSDLCMFWKTQIEKSNSPRNQELKRRACSK